MHPTLCTIGPLTLYSYGLMLAMAVVICSYLLAKEAKVLGIKHEEIFDFVFGIMISGIIGARIFYVILDWGFFSNNPLEIIMVHKGGLAWQGGFILGFLFGLGYAYRKRWPIWKLLDLTAPYLALGQAIGRIGCFFNGCCFGKHFAGGFYFPFHQDFLYPTQLYESVGLFAIFLILKKFQGKMSVEGKAFSLYLILASFLRFFIEFFRNDHAWEAIGLSLNQWICAVLIIIAIFLFCLKKK